MTVYHDRSFYNHDPGRFHPEIPARLTAVMEACGEVPDIEVIDECRKAARDEIELIHTSRYFDYIESVPDKPVMLDADTYFGPGSFEASLKAAGAVIEAVKLVSSGGRRAFCAVRPPGHHAEADKARGFCIFNNIAIGAAYAIDRGLAERIVILDWDVHHGNGTQHVFYDNANVFYISLHLYPYYPGSGGIDEIGEGHGLGFTLNLPMNHGAGDKQYEQAFEGKVLPAIDNYKPDLIMISAGFDAHKSDPMAGIELSTEMFGSMTKMMTDMAAKHCREKIVSVLEGGYDLIALKDSVKLHLEVLRDG